MQKRLLKNGNQKFLVGDSVTLADFDSAHLAYSHFLNEKADFYKEQSEKLREPEYAQILKYYENLKNEVFKEYFESRTKGFPY